MYNTIDPQRDQQQQQQPLQPPRVNLGERFNLDWSSNNQQNPTKPEALDGSV